MADHQPPVVEEARPSFFSNLVAVVGLIILVIVVIWGLLHLVGLSQGWFTSLFGNSTPKVTITAPASVASGEEFKVSWKYSTSEKGNFAFVYQCKSGLSVKSNGNSIPCGNAYTVGSLTSLTLTPTLSGVASTTMPISVAFLPSATSSKLVQGSATIAIHSATTTQTTTTETTTHTQNTNTGSVKPTPTPSPKPTPTPTPAPVVKTPADIRVDILALGVIDPYTGQFVNRAPQGPGDIAAAQFNITNVGGSTSGVYYFSANLPTIGGYVYNSPAQAPLSPGSHVVNTLRWTESAPAGTFTVSVTGDSYTANNFASATFTGSGYYPYQQYPQPTYYPQY